MSRASALGLRGVYDPRPVLFHHHRRSRPEEVKPWLAAYDIGRGAYYAKALLDRDRRWIYLWPTLRRLGGNLWRGNFAATRREFRGAWRYLFGRSSAARGA